MFKDYRRYKLEVCDLDYLPGHVYGFIDFDTNEIKINRKDDPFRQRCALFHEMSHTIYPRPVPDVLHQNIVELGTFLAGLKKTIETNVKSTDYPVKITSSEDGYDIENGGNIRSNEQLAEQMLKIFCQVHKIPIDNERTKLMAFWSQIIPREIKDWPKELRLPYMERRDNGRLLGK